LVRAKDNEIWDGEDWNGQIQVENGTGMGAKLQEAYSGYLQIRELLEYIGIIAHAGTIQLAEVATGFIWEGRIVIVVVVLYSMLFIYM
jgi:hypothetical protein